MSVGLANQDVAAIMAKLEDTEAVMDLVNAVGHLNVEPDTPRPYIIIVDIAADPVYAFGHTMAMENAAYAIRVITQDDDDESAQTKSSLILDAIMEALQGVALSVTGFTTLTLHAGPREPSTWENISDQVRYLRQGRKWFGSFAAGSP